MKTYKNAVLIYSDQPAGFICATDEYLKHLAEKQPALMMVQTYPTREQAIKACAQENSRQEKKIRSEYRKVLDNFFSKL